ncbi:hypothetical protein BDN70DRAFT_989053, partial [Pholiota conissans]
KYKTASQVSVTFHYHHHHHHHLRYFESILQVVSIPFYQKQSLKKFLVRP